MEDAEPKAKQAKPKPEAPGWISADAVYRLDEFAARMNLAKHGLRAARRSGLKVRKAGRNGYVVGKDWIEWLLTQPEVKG